MKDKILHYFLVWLAVLSVCFAGFSDAWFFIAWVPVSFVINSSNQVFSVPWSWDKMTCVQWSSTNFYNFILYTFDPNWTFVNFDPKDNYSLFCYTWSDTLYLRRWDSSNNITVKYFYLDIPPGDCPACPSCPTCPSQYTSLECQSEYSLIPISSVDQNYCTTNNLCPSEDCPDTPIYTWDLTPWVSNIFINDVFHPGAYNVIMNIPQEIDWDYTYTNSGYNFNLDVVWYNQDTEYIEGLIDVQNYKPTSEDFTNVFGGFGYFGWLLVACLFVILVFYFIKKAFK